MKSSKHGAEGERYLESNGKTMAQAVVSSCIDPVCHPSFPTKRRDGEESSTSTPISSCFFTSTSVWTTAAKSHNLHSNQTCVVQGAATFTGTKPERGYISRQDLETVVPCGSVPQECLYPC